MKKLLILPALLLFSGHSVFAQELTILDTDNIQSENTQNESPGITAENNIEKEEVEFMDTIKERLGMNFEEDDSRDKYEKNDYEDDDEDIRGDHHEGNDRDEDGDEEELIMTLIGISSGLGGLLLGGLGMFLYDKKRQKIN